MDRRNFLKGTILSATAAAGTALVRLAEPKEIQLLKPELPVLMSGEYDDWANPWGGFDHKAYIVDRDGRFRPIGFITSIQYNCSAMDITTLDGEIQLVPGLRENGTARFERRF